MKIKTLLLITFLAALVGCAAPLQYPIKLDTTTLMSPDIRLGVATSVLPQPSLMLPGADCLLCMAVAASANSTLSKHTKTLSTAEIEALKGEVIETLKARGKAPVVLADPIAVVELPKTKKLGEGFSRRDFSSLAEPLQVDQLLVIDITQAGMTRPYAAYVPRASPQARVSGAVYMVDVKTNAFSWYMPVDYHLSAEGEWDEPPEYPALTNSYYQLLEKLRDEVLAAFPVKPKETGE